VNNYKGNSQYVKEVCARIKSAYNLANDVQLAAFLDIASSTLAMQQKRGNLDFAMILQKCSDLDLNWILRGEDLLGRHTGESGTLYSQLPLSVQADFEQVNRELETCRTELQKVRHENDVLRDVIETLRPG
jgi:hypothetical protein